MWGVERAALLWSAPGGTSPRYATGCSHVQSDSGRAEKVCGWNGGHPGLTVTTLHKNCTQKTTQELRLRMKYARKLLFFYYVAVISTSTGGQNRHKLVWSVIFNLPELPTNDEAWNESHIASTSVRLYWRTPRVAHQKTKRETSVVSKRQLNQASWNRTVWKIGSENQLIVHN